MGIDLWFRVNIYAPRPTILKVVKVLKLTPYRRICFNANQCRFPVQPVLNFKPVAITENDTNVSLIDTFFQLFGFFCDVYEAIPYICSRGKFFRPITMPNVYCSPQFQFPLIPEIIFE